MAASVVVNPSQPLYCCWRSQGEKTQIFFLPQSRSSLHNNPSTKQCSFSSSSSSSSSSSRKRNLHVIRANTGVDFGARDPFPAEIESNFSDKVLGCWDTEHVILVPNAPALSLAAQSCIHPLPESIQAFSLDEAKALLRKVRNHNLGSLFFFLSFFCVVLGFSHGMIITSWLCHECCDCDWCHGIYVFLSFVRY